MLEVIKISIVTVFIVIGAFGLGAGVYHASDKLVENIVSILNNTHNTNP